MKADPARRLLSLVASLPRATAQNRLMRLADRELAVVMMFMEDRDRERLLGILAPAKARRVREELVIQKHIAMAARPAHGRSRPPAQAILTPIRPV